MTKKEKADLIGKNQEILIESYQRNADRKLKKKSSKT